MAVSRKAVSRKKAAPKARKPANPLKLDNRNWDRQAVMDIVCNRTASSTQSLHLILSRKHNGHSLPTRDSIMRWLREDEGLATQYAEAKADQADYIADQMLEIADDATNDWMEQKLLADGENPKRYKENTWRSKLRIDTRKWIASKLRPSRYGDKLLHGGDKDNPILHSVHNLTPDDDPEEAARKYREFIGAIG